MLLFEPYEVLYECAEFQFAIGTESDGQERYALKSPDTEDWLILPKDVVVSATHKLKSNIKQLSFRFTEQ
jgi:hypothetical protein